MDATTTEHMRFYINSFDYAKPNSTLSARRKKKKIENFNQQQQHKMHETEPTKKKIAIAKPNQR